MKQKKIWILGAVLLSLLLAAAGTAAALCIDWRAPTLTLIDSFEGGYNEPISMYHLIESVSDRSDFTLSLAGNGSIDQANGTITFATTGSYPVEITATDAGGRSTTCSITLVITDRTPPELVAEDFTLYLDGTEPDYLSHAVAEDEIDGDLTSAIQVDSSQVDPKQAGCYPITYSVADSAGNATSATAYVEVTQQPAESITLDRTSLSLSGNEYHQLHATVSPEHWTGTLTWSSSDEAVATVSDGLIVWTGVGNCVITVQADDVHAECTLECNPPAAQSVWLDQHALSLEENSQATLTAQVFPSNWSGTVEWSSSNSLVAEVVDGVIYWKGEETCEITASAEGQSDTCTVTCATSTQFQWASNCNNKSEQNEINAEKSIAVLESLC